MKILFISTKPASLDAGSEIRNYYLLQALQQVDSDVQILYLNLHQKPFFTDLGAHHPPVHQVQLEPRSGIKTLRSLLRMEIPYVSHLQDYDANQQLQKLVAEADLLFISELDGYFAVAPLLSVRKKTAKLVLDCHNVDYARFKMEMNTFSWPKRLLGSLLAEKLRLLEANAVQQADLTLACSELDQRYFAQFVTKEKVIVVPNGVDVSKIHPRFSVEAKNPTVLFLGNLSYVPNQEGIFFYLQHVRPLVKKKFPGLETVIIGKNSEQVCQGFSDKDHSIHVKGFVSSTKPFIDDATVCVCPLLSGSGTRLKLLEYMAYGKAIVSTSIGAEGLSVEHGKHLLLADSAEQFADSIARLISDTKLSLQLGKAARALVEQRYNWSKICQDLENVVKKIS